MSSHSHPESHQTEELVTRNLDLDSFAAIIDHLKNLSRPNLEMVAEIVMEQIANEDLASLEKNTAPRRDSLYELTRELSRHVKRRVEHINVPPTWARQCEHCVCFDEFDDDQGIFICEECGLEADEFLACEHCQNQSGALNRSI